MAALLGASLLLVAGTSAHGLDAEADGAVPELSATVVSASYDGGVLVEVQGSGFDLGQNVQARPDGVYLGVAPRGTDIVEDASAFVAEAHVAARRFTDGAFERRISLAVEDLTRGTEYDVFAWSAHGNPTAGDPLAADAPIEIDWSQLERPDEPGPTEPPPTTPPDPEPEPTSGPEPDVEVDGDEVTGAVLRWGVSNQANARSHNPVSINLLSAGVANPGRGGIQLKREQWSARSGAVTIEKPDGKGAFKRATWAGLSTSPGGETIGLDGPFSQHTVVFRDGTGEIDRASGDARITWKGTFSVVFYGGNSIFTVTDPELVLSDGKGALRATLGGFVSDRDDASTWGPAPGARATIATLTGVTLKKRGVTVQPAWDGVQVVGSEPQHRSGQHFGAFPQEMISYLKGLGTDQFWYSTGLSTDATKRPLPIHLSWTPEEIATGQPEDETAAPTVQNPVSSPAPVPPALPGGTPLAAPVPAALPPAVPVVADQSSALPGNVQLVSAAPAAVSEGLSSSDERWLWLGGACLLLAALLLLVPTASIRRS